MDGRTALKAILVSHTHWDREWYRTFQGFRARLVDTIDGVLERIESDPDFVFLLDGQTIVLEDYLEVRPTHRKALERACRAGRIAIGPWYVQPDSLLPSGEAHVRNLLEGRRVGAALGPVSRVAYTPDSFGHPAQLPQIFAGFGLEAFVSWRGHGNEIDRLPSEYRWVAPDGSSVLSCVLRKGYFAAALLPREIEHATRRLLTLAEELAATALGDSVLLMNGIDHAAPDPHDGEVLAALAVQEDWSFERGLLEDFVASVPDKRPTHAGELLGARLANLLPGVWSTRMPLKLRNRACERALEALAEPFSALGEFAGLTDERPALRQAWRALLRNQAHDSICGCSLDRVHRQMDARYDESEELATETTQRVLEGLAGLGPGRAPPTSETIELAVFNPSPHTRAGVVRFALDPFPAFTPGAQGARIHPWLLVGSENAARAGFTIDGKPVRVLPGCPDGRFLLVPEMRAIDVEFVVDAVPAFGWKRVRLEPAPPCPEEIDSGQEISAGSIIVRVEPEGTLEVSLDGQRFPGLCGIEDAGDRGDSYDADLIDAQDVTPESVVIQRRQHPNGLRELQVDRQLRLPLELTPDREQRSAESTGLMLRVTARLWPGTDRVDLAVRLENTARDHRLRLLFPTGAPTSSFLAASHFDRMRRETRIPDSTGWIHEAPRTFPHQGWVCANGLSVVAPGLPEAEVNDEGRIALTLLRCVGWLARHDLRSRPGPAGPAIETPDAQCLGTLEARLSLFRGPDPTRARDAEVDLRAVAAGPEPRLPEGVDLLAIEPETLLLSAFKPAEVGVGAVLRVLNPGEEQIRARVRLGFPVSRAFAVHLDESPAPTPVEFQGAELAFDVPPRALRSVFLRP